MSVPVRKCRNASRIGCTGIVMQETANTFKVVTKANTLKGLTLSSVDVVLFLLVLQSSRSKEPFLRSPCPISPRLKPLRIPILVSTLNYTETNSDFVQRIVPLENSRQKRPPNSDEKIVLPVNSSYYSSLTKPAIATRAPYQHSIFYNHSMLFASLSPIRYQGAHKPLYTTLRTKRVSESNYGVVGPQTASSFMYQRPEGTNIRYMMSRKRFRYPNFRLPTSKRPQVHALLPAVSIDGNGDV